MVKIKNGVLIRVDAADIINGTYTIPESVKSIDPWAFSDCTGLTQVTIPGSVTLIDWAFACCTGLTQVTISYGVTLIGARAFYGCTDLTSVEIPKGVASIGESVFSGCTGLKSITIPEGVTSIAGWAFLDCTGLTQVTISDGVTLIGARAFYGCTGLTQVTIPGSVKSIGDAAFLDCTGLTQLTIPNDVASIAQCAFSGCRGLTQVTIPGSVKSIDHWAFSGCTNVRQVIVDVSTVNNLDLDGHTLLDRVILSGAPANMIRAMISAGADFTDAGLAAVSDEMLKSQMKLWARQYQIEALYTQASEIYYLRSLERAKHLPKNLTKLPEEIWLKILELGRCDGRHPDYPRLTKEDLQGIVARLEGGEDDYRVVHTRRAVKESVLSGTNKILAPLYRLGQEQADEARLCDWKRSGGSTAIVALKHGAF
jgi:hypothetical protein